MAKKRAIWADWIGPIIGGLGGVWLWRWPQPPGYAIGLLAAVAVIMTFSKPNVWQKFSAIFLAVGLYILEVRSINNERADQQTAAAVQLAAILSDNKIKTKTILNDNQGRFSATEQHFNEVITEADNLTGISRHALQSSQQTLDSLSGKDSFAYLLPIPGGPTGIGLFAIARGKYALTGVTVNYFRNIDPPQTEFNAQLGTLGQGNFSTTIMNIIPKIGPNGIDQYVAFISAQNGTTREVIDIKAGKTPGTWETRFRVWKLHVSGDKETSAVSVKLLLARDIWWDGSGDGPPPITHPQAGPPLLPTRLNRPAEKLP